MPRSVTATIEVAHQAPTGDWARVFADIAAELQAKLESRIDSPSAVMFGAA